MTDGRAPVASPAFPIVGIGASAGGLEALILLLGALPPDTGMAFVTVQHLDPVRESLLPEILQKRTAMPVAQAKDGMLVRPDHFYIIPPNVHMGIVRGRLKLSPRPPDAPATSVNAFLTSLATERGNQAVAVILSGTASDGANGVRAIKAEGGLVFAQDEASAAHSGMPHSAMETGVVDFVLPPEKIAEELARIALHPILTANAPPIFDDATSLAAIFAHVRRSTGVDFSLYKPATMRRRLLRRLLVHKIERLSQYVKVLERRPEEARALHDDLLIHVTHFFREPKAVEALRAKSFPRILKGLPADAPIRVWVPGCASGEEVYTLAITLLDFLGERDVMNPVQIFATDISEPALEKARAGAYPLEIAADVPPRLLRRFFTKSDRGYEIVKRVRDLCVFARQDLTKDPPFANVDIISCCNVLIYLAPEAQKRILPMFHYALRPAGTLVLSSAETVGEFSTLFAAADKKWRLYYKKEGPRPPFPLARAGAAPSQPPGRKAPAAGWPETDVQKVADRILLARYSPAGVVVNGELEILHFRGRINRFLEPASGRASLTLLKMLPAHATSAIKALFAKARRTDASASSLIELGGSGSSADVRVEFLPFRLPVSGARYYIVLFEDAADAAGKRKGAAHPRPAEPQADAAALRRLKTELASTRGYLQTLVEEHEAANEELRSANEEIVSSNEELQSTNEELEVAKEELQAANEELSTLNEELQTRNNDLGQLNNDLVNLISSIHLPIVMVGPDLRIRRFSPMAEKVMNLVSTDVGRPIGDIKLRIELPDIERIIGDVMESVEPKVLDVRDKDGRSFSVRVRPYRTSDNRIDGAVVVFMDNDGSLRGLAKD
jgi:two-component system CheB/CheR fusion protein